MAKYLTKEQTLALAKRLTVGEGEGQSVANVLTVEDCAMALSTDCRNIKRLIAIGMLPAQRLGINGPIRLLADMLERYVALGAPYYDAPPISNGAEFLGFDVESMAIKLEGTIAHLIEQSIDDEAIKAQIEAADRRRGNPALTQAGIAVEFPSEIKVAFSAEMKAAVLAAVAPPLNRRDTEPLEKFQSMGEVLVAHRLRTIVSGLVRKSNINFTKMPADSLYESRDTFKGFFDAGFAKLKTQYAAVVSRTYVRVDHRVSFVVSMADVIGQVQPERIPLVTF